MCVCVCAQLEVEHRNIDLENVRRICTEMVQLGREEASSSPGDVPLIGTSEDLESTLLHGLNNSQQNVRVRL